MRSVGLYTLGCKVSQYETEAIGETFEKHGFTVMPFDSVCDAYVINTCTVTAESDRKSRQMIRRAIKRNPDAVVAVVGCYSQRTPEELLRLRQRNLTMVYMGLESGCDEVLKRMRKGHTAADIVAAGQKINAAGIELSVTAISGLGGVELWREHAMDTAAALSAMKPAYIGLLTLMVEPGTPLYDWVESGRFTLLDSHQVLEETALLVAQLDCEGAVFRMNHASNYPTLKGTLNEDKQALLQRIHSAMSGRTDLRPEYFRAL